MLSVMLASPIAILPGNVAIVNALLSASAMAITPLLSLYTLDMRQLYPSYLIGALPCALALAALLFYLRPQESVPKQS